ncbi:molecular chaperone [Enterobacter sp. Ap-916]|uniref:fimbrial biogenesis chaperone n=1 Tax=unclassified Enterobacter TaxID=2608935 RepID=UPI00141F41EA|nr:MULTISPECIES: molecular chaperone [unclassified Enterobacter]NIF58009.1 molecular chaperone [Enterobacter sp. Ap-867]NIG28049.1 molecular chaperone [Enterobacter sp. Ap-916]
MMKLLSLLSHASGLAGLLLPLVAQADGGIALTKTRLVFNAAEKTQTLIVKNNSDRAWLIHSRSLTALDGDDAGTPFIVIPPLFRLAAGKEQTLRIMRKEQPPEQDRESLFYLSIKAIPASQQSDAAAQVSAGLRFNLKLIYRPAKLKLDNELPACHLNFSRSGNGLSVRNPSPYFITLGALTLDGQPRQADASPLMLPPFGRQVLDAAGPTRHVTWQVVDDRGGLAPLCKADAAPTELP